MSTHRTRLNLKVALALACIAQAGCVFGDAREADVQEGELVMTRCDGWPDIPLGYRTHGHVTISNGTFDGVNLFDPDFDQPADEWEIDTDHGDHEEERGEWWVAADDSTSIAVLYTPGEVGADEAVFSVRTDHPDYPELDCTLRGEGATP